MGQYRNLIIKKFVRTHLVQVWVPNRTNQRPRRSFPQRSDLRLNATLRSSTQKEHAVLPTSKRTCGVYEQNSLEHSAENRKRTQNRLGHETLQCAMGLQDKFQNQRTSHTILLVIRLGSSDASGVPNPKSAHIGQGRNDGGSFRANTPSTTPRPRRNMGKQPSGARIEPTTSQSIRR